MKKILLIACLIFSLCFISGCSYETDIIEKHGEELKIVFGDYKYKELPRQIAIDTGTGESEYRLWEIKFTDIYGDEYKVLINNYDGFNSQIIEIYKTYLQIKLVKDNTYITNNYSSDENIISKYLTFKLKNVDYKITNFNLTIDYDGAYSSIGGIINDYKFFSLYNRTLEDLLKKGKVSIDKICYYPIDRNKILSNNELNQDLEYLRNITEKIKTKVTVNNVIYYKVELKNGYSGEYVDTSEYSL